MDYLKLCILIIGSLPAILGNIQPKNELILLESKRFVAYLEIPKRFGNVSHCWFKYNDENKMEVPVDSPITTNRDDWVYNYPYSSCGIRVEKLSTASAGKWTLEAVNTKGERIIDSINITIISKLMARNNYYAEKFDTIIFTQPGLPLNITCSNVLKSRDLSCTITNDRLDEWNSCQTSTTITNPTSFQCVTQSYYSSYNTSSVETFYAEMLKPEPYSVATTTENENSIVLNCKFADPINNCKALGPNGKTFSIVKHSNCGQNSTCDYVTSLSSGLCSIQIPKALTDTSDMGMWTIYDTFGSEANTGCIFYVGLDKNSIIQTELLKMEKYKEIAVYYDDAYHYRSYTKIRDISCQAPFVLDQCYLKRKYGDMYFPDPDSFERTKNIGRCTFKNLEIQYSGVYTCGLIGKDYPLQVVQTYQVAVKSSKGEAPMTNLRAKAGNSVELLCRSALNAPISNCAFSNPRGDVFLPKRNGTNDRLEYLGQGLDQGDCGILIKNIAKDEFGGWVCQFNTQSGNRGISPVSTFNMWIYEDRDYVLENVLYLVLGMVVISIIALLIGAIIYMRQRKIKYANLTETNSQNSVG